MDSLRAIWRKFVEFDSRFHTRLLVKYPSVVPRVDRVLIAVVDKFISSPVFGVLLGLVLVVLGIVGVHTLVLISVGAVWVISFFWIAKSEPLRKLTVGTRLVTLLLIGLLLAVGARSFGTWAIREHDKEQQATNAPPSQPKQPVSDQSIVPPAASPTPAQIPPSTPKPKIPIAPNEPKLRPKPEVFSTPQEPAKPTQPSNPVMLTAGFINPTLPSLFAYNPSTDVVQGVLWEMVAIRTSDLCFFGFQTRDMGFIKPQSKSANYSMELATMPKSIEAGCDGSIKEGDELTGSVSIDCPQCSVQTYIIHLVWKQSGWYFESDLKGGYIVPKDMKSKEARQKYVQLLTSGQFTSKRSEIMPQPQ